MPQHIWQTRGPRRICDACDVVQTKRTVDWLPEVSPICPGNGRDSRRRNQLLPSEDGPKAELEAA